MGIPARSVMSIAVLVALAACGGSGGSSKSSASSASTGSSLGAGASSSVPSSGGIPAGNATACSLVTQSDAASITGDASLTQSTVAGTRVCLYTKPGQPAAAGDSVYVAIYPMPSVNTQTLQSLLNQRISGTGRFQSVSGVGDTAYERTSTNGAGLVFAKGHNVVVIGAGSTTRSGSDMVAAIESVARHAAGQL